MFDQWHDYRDDPESPAEALARRVRVGASFLSGSVGFLLAGGFLGAPTPWPALLVLFLSGVAGAVAKPGWTGLAVTVLGCWVVDAGLAIYWAISSSLEFWNVYLGFLFAFVALLAASAGFGVVLMVRRVVLR